MERTMIEDCFKKSGKVTVKGWIHETRDLKKVRFLILKDISGRIQITGIDGKTNPETFELLDNLNRESAVKVTGELKECKQAPGGKELLPDSITMIAEAKNPLPIDTSDYSKTELPLRLDYRCLSLRIRKSQAVFKIQSALLRGMQEFLNKKDYLQVFTPSLMGVPSESGSEVFEVKFFDRIAYLRQDPQLHRQLTILGGLEKIYDIGPSWRAEKSHTPRHLTEHRTIAVESAFIKDERDTMRLEEQVIVAGVKKVIELCKEELKLFGLENKIKVPKTPFLEIKFPDVYDILGKKGKELYGEDLDREAEKMIWEYVQKEYPECNFYFFNGFPHKIKPFYVMEGEKNNEKWAKSVDLNFRGMEMSSGGQREHRYEKLMRNVKERKMPMKSVEWFTKFFKWGAPPHGGFSIGIERLTMVLLGLSNVREASLFPRDIERLTP